MKIIYTTLNNADEAKRISQKILEQKLANCTNWFPITCMYSWEDKIEYEPEVVLIIKTKEEKYEEILELIKSEIDYTNFVGMLPVEKVSEAFSEWLNNVVK